MWLRSKGKERLYDSSKFVPVPGTRVWFQVPSINCHQNSCRLLPGFSIALTSQHHSDPTHRFWRQGTFQGWCSSAILFPWVLPVNRFTIYWHCWDWTGEVKHRTCEKMSVTHLLKTNWESRIHHWFCQLDGKSIKLPTISTTICTITFALELRDKLKDSIPQFFNVQLKL